MALWTNSGSSHASRYHVTRSSQAAERSTKWGWRVPRLVRAHCVLNTRYCSDDTPGRWLRDGHLSERRADSTWREHLERVQQKFILLDFCIILHESETPRKRAARARRLHTKHTKELLRSFAHTEIRCHADEARDS